LRLSFDLLLRSKSTVPSRAEAELY